MSDFTPHPDKAVLQRLPVNSWAWPRVVVFVPMPQALPHADAVFPHFIGIAQTGVPFMWLPYGRTDAVRNQAAQGLLDSDYTHILMLDSDQRHPLDIVQRLCRWVIDDPERLIVGGLYFRRGEPYDPLVWRLVDNEPQIMTEWQQGLIECDVIGTGAILIDRRVFGQVERPWFWYDYSGIASPGYSWPTEDITFCLAAREAGIKIYCDTTVDSPHAYTSFINERTYRSFRAMKAAQETQENENQTSA